MPRNKKCLETRTRPDGLVRRRYLLPDGTRQTTIEIPKELLHKMQFLDKLEDALKAVVHAQSKKARNDQIRSLKAAGLSLSQIAKQVNLHKSHVHRVVNSEQTFEETLESVEDVCAFWGRLISRIKKGDSNET